MSSSDRDHKIPAFVSAPLFRRQAAHQISDFQHFKQSVESQLLAFIRMLGATPEQQKQFIRVLDENDIDIRIRALNSGEECVEGLRKLIMDFRKHYGEQSVLLARELLRILSNTTHVVIHPANLLILNVFQSTYAFAAGKGLSEDEGLNFAIAMMKLVEATHNKLNGFVFCYFPNINPGRRVGIEHIFADLKREIADVAKAQNWPKFQEIADDYSRHFYLQILDPRMQVYFDALKWTQERGWLTYFSRVDFAWGAAKIVSDNFENLFRNPLLQQLADTLSAMQVQIEIMAREMGVVGSQGAAEDYMKFFTKKYYNPVTLAGLEAAVREQKEGKDHKEMKASASEGSLATPSLDLPKLELPKLELPKADADKVNKFHLD